MRSIRKLLWPFTKSRMALTDGSQPDTPTQTATSLCVWYHSIHDLPLKIFKKCQITGNLQALVISGQPHEDDLLKAWDEILGQFHEVIGDVKTIRRLVIYKEISLLTINLREVYDCVNALRRRYHSFFHKKLNQLTESDLVLDPENPLEYSKTLIRYLKRSTPIKRNLELKKIEYEAIKQGAVGKQPDEAYYSSVLISLSDHARYQITEDISTYEYCERFRRLTEYIKSQKKVK